MPISRKFANLQSIIDNLQPIVDNFQTISRQSGNFQTNWQKLPIANLQILPICKYCQILPNIAKFSLAKNCQIQFSRQFANLQTDRQIANLSRNCQFVQKLPICLENANLLRICCQIDNFSTNLSTICLQIGYLSTKLPSRFVYKFVYNGLQICRQIDLAILQTNLWINRQIAKLQLAICQLPICQLPICL